MVIIKAHFTSNIYYKSHHLSADGAVNSTQPRAIPPVGYNAGAYAGQDSTLQHEHSIMYK